MVLVSDKPSSNIGILQTKLSYREGYEARRVGLSTIPLDQHIEGGHGELQACLNIHLLYLSTQFLWWHAVADIIGVKSSTALRSNSRCPWRPRAGTRNVSNTAVRRARSPLRPCESVTANVHG